MSIQETTMRYLLRPNSPGRGKLLLCCLIWIIPLSGIAQEDPYLMGRASMMQGSPESASRYLQEALEENPGRLILTGASPPAGLC